MIHRLDGDSLTLEPLETGAVLGQERRHLLQALGVVGVDPLNLQVGQQGAVNQLDLHGDQSNVLEAVVAAATKVVEGISRANQHDVLNTDTELAVLVVTGFVGQGHAGNKRNVVVGNTGAASVRPFVDVQESTDTVASSVTEVETIGPESTTSQDIQKVSRSAIREDGRVNGDVSLENAGEAALLVSRGVLITGSTKLVSGTCRPDQRNIRSTNYINYLEVKGTGDIGGSVNVLSARVAKVDEVGVDAGSAGLLGLVVNDGTVGTSGRDGVEGKTNKSSLLTIWKT